MNELSFRYERLDAGYIKIIIMNDGVEMYWRILKTAPSRRRK